MTIIKSLSLLKTSSKTIQILKFTSLKKKKVQNQIKKVVLSFRFKIMKRVMMKCLKHQYH